MRKMSLLGSEDSEQSQKVHLFGKLKLKNMTICRPRGRPPGLGVDILTKGSRVRIGFEPPSWGLFRILRAPTDWLRPIGGPQKKKKKNMTIRTEEHNELKKSNATVYGSPCLCNFPLHIVLNHKKM